MLTFKIENNLTKRLYRAKERLRIAVKNTIMAMLWDVAQRARSLFKPGSYVKGPRGGWRPEPKARKGAIYNRSETLRGSILAKMIGNQYAGKVLYEHGSNPYNGGDPAIYGEYLARYCGAGRNPIGDAWRAEKGKFRTKLQAAIRAALKDDTTLSTSFGSGGNYTASQAPNYGATSYRRSA